MKECLDAYLEHGSYKKAAKAIGASAFTVGKWVRRAEGRMGKAWEGEIGLTMALRIGIEMKMPRRYLMRLVDELRDEELIELWTNKVHARR